MSSEMIISKEIAQEQINFLFDYYDLDLDDMREIGKGGKQDFGIAIDFNIKKLLRALQKGRLEIINDNGTPIINQHMAIKYPFGNKLTYKVITGAAKIEMAKHDDPNSKLFGLLGALCGEGFLTISSLQGPDLSTAELIGAIFLLV